MVIWVGVWLGVGSGALESEVGVAIGLDPSVPVVGAEAVAFGVLGVAPAVAVGVPVGVAAGFPAGFAAGVGLGLATGVGLVTTVRAKALVAG